MLVIRTITATLVCLGSVAVKVPAQSLAVITGTVRNAVNGAPVANATVRVLDERRSYVTSGDGTFRLALRRPEAELHVTAVGFAPDARRVPFTAGASVVITIELQPSAVPLDEVITLGTRALERTATSSAVPIDVISNQLLENTGVVETWQQLQRLVPSVFAPHIPLTDNGMRPITLRGLAPHHTLVLVNGKRQHPAAALLSGPSVPNTTFTDLNAIPGSAIDHIEVLRDGASAEYGSDAIGGVVNVVLKSGNRRDLRTTVGQVYSSEGGRTWRDGRMFDADGTFGLVAENGSYLTLTGELRDRDGTNRSYPDQRQQYFTGDSRNDQPPRISSNLGDGDVNGLSFFLNGAFPLNRATELYAFAGAAHRNNVSPDAFFRRPLDSATVRAIFPDGFLPKIESKISDLSAVAGIRGSVHGWRWDVSTGSGANRIAYRVENSNNVSLGAASPTSFYAGRIAAQQWTSNADVSRDVMIGSLPLTLAGGMELRVEKYLIRAGDPDSWRDGGVRILDGPQLGRPAATGSQGLTGFRPADEVSPRRTNTAFYLEAEGRPFQRLLLQSAVRAEHYSDAGSTSDGKLAGRVELLKGIAVRGSMSSGFRAPSLSEEYFSRTTTVFRQVGGVGTFLTTRTFPVNTREAQLMGATKLRPETSVNRSVGLVLNRASLPLLTADYYEIKIADRIGLTGVVTDTSLSRVFEENGIRGISGGNYFSNKIDTRTRGVDVIASRAFLLSRAGIMRIVGGYNYNKTLVTSVAPAPAELGAFQTRLFTRMNRGVIEDGQPQRTILFDLNYSIGALGLNLNNQRSGPTAQLDQTKPEFDQHVSAKWATDVRASYQLRSRVVVALSAVNLFDVYPDEWWDFKDGLSARGFSMQGIFRYPAALSSLGLNGRTVYVQLVYR